MMPVIGIGTAIFFALQLLQTHLSHSRSLADAQIRITHLESELAHLQTVQRRQAVTWGDSLGRVIKHVQTVAVGTGAKDAVEGATVKVHEKADEAKAQAGVILTNAVDQAKVAQESLAVKTTEAKQIVKDGLEQAERNVTDLLDRVKEEFGVVEPKPKGWKSWIGL